MSYQQLDSSRNPHPHRIGIWTVWNPQTSFRDDLLVAKIVFLIMNFLGKPDSNSPVSINIFTFYKEEIDSVLYHLCLFVSSFHKIITFMW